MTDKRIQLFHGALGSSSADVYLRIRDRQLLEKRAVASIAGPFCERARTLSTDFRFQQFVPPDLYRVTIVDPCLWTPDLPALYRWTLHSDGKEPLATGEVGLRGLGIRGRRMMLDNRRVVLRGADVGQADDEPLDAWREQRLTLFCRRPKATLCQQASREGVMLAVVEDAYNADALRLFSQYAAVCLVRLPADAEVPSPQRRAMHPNLLLAADMNERTDHVPDWADLVVVPAQSPIIDRVLSQPTPRPVVVARPLGETVSIARLRGACERLQRDLSPRYDLDGYVV